MRLTKLRNTMHKSPSAVANHIQELFAFGIDYKTIAKLAGVNENTVLNIKDGRVQCITRKTEQKILAVTKVKVSTRHQPKGPMVSSEWAGIHLRKLKRTTGATNEAIAKASQVCIRTVQRVVSTRSVPIIERTERRLLSLSVDEVRSQTHWNGRLPETADIVKHCHTLLAKGVSMKGLARASGVDYNTLKRVMNGQKRVWTKTRKRILSTTQAATISNRTILPSQPFFRLIHDLRKRFGFSYRAISQRLGGYNLRRRNFLSKGIRFENVVKIMRLHDKLTRPAPKLIVRSRGTIKSGLYGLSSDARYNP